MFYINSADDTLINLEALKVFLYIFFSTAWQVCVRVCACVYGYLSTSFKSSCVIKVRICIIFLFKLFFLPSTGE